MPRRSRRRPGAQAADQGPLRPTTDMVALYHIVYRDEGFEEAATALFELVREAERTYPGQRRVLYLDIEGHRNEQGGYDHDMLELQREFVLGVLRPFLAEAHLPLAGHVVRSPRSAAIFPTSW